ncbi:MAG: sulfonate transport system substrate-binding protein [Hyphomicrobiales bacterium]|jgi:NitT/TauT family transport system substrate-binding protein
MRSRVRVAVAVLALLATVPAGAEVSEVRLSKQYGLPYLPFMVMEHFRLLEKQAERQGLALKVSWTTLSNSSAMMEAIISGQMDFIAPGLPTLATMWDKTVGTQNEIRALTAVQSMPYVLVTRSPNIKTIRDFTEHDRIALPAVKLTGHAIALQMAAAKEWGREHYDRLDPITVSLSHPDATAALLAGKSEITAHFASSPFYYIELANPAVHRVLHSYEVAGGRHTNGVLMASRKFYEANPKVCAAVVAALEEADVFIKSDPRKAAEIYIALAKEKRSTLDEIETMVKDPDVDYTTTPVGVMKFVAFMNLAGTVKKKPASWKDLFFPTAHGLPGN